ncbi:MAG TPA: hypothetical protein DDW52_13510 [Planctomycetaceae bacterium]|nr:hypothetical protein [Planctomycetaceae bacterium]
MDTNLSVNAASAIKQSQYKNEAASAIAAKTLAVQKQQGQAAVDLVKQVAQVSVSAQLAEGRLDVTV